MGQERRNILEDPRVRRLGQMVGTQARRWFGVLREEVMVAREVVKILTAAREPDRIVITQTTEPLNRVRGVKEETGAKTPIVPETKGRTSGSVNERTDTSSQSGLGERIRQDQAMPRKHPTPLPDKFFLEFFLEEAKKAQMKKRDGTIWNSLALFLRYARAREQLEELARSIPEFQRNYTVSTNPQFSQYVAIDPNYKEKDHNIGVYLAEVRLSMPPSHELAVQFSPDCAGDLDYKLQKRVGVVAALSGRHDLGSGVVLNPFTQPDLYCYYEIGAPNRTYSESDYEYFYRTRSVYDYRSQERCNVLDNIAVEQSLLTFNGSFLPYAIANDLYFKIYKDIISPYPDQMKYPPMTLKYLPLDKNLDPSKLLRYRQRRDFIPQLPERDYYRGASSDNNALGPKHISRYDKWELERMKKHNQSLTNQQILRDRSRK